MVSPRLVQSLCLCAGLLALAALAACDGSSAVGPGRCALDADCPPGQGCDDGVCHATCETSADCPAGDCVGGFCRVACASDADCGTHEMCDQGHCVARPVDDGGLDGAEDGDGGGGDDGGAIEACQGVDRDQDGLPDRAEDRDGNGRFDPGETNPDLADSDGDGIPDGLEDRNCNGQVDPGETDPLHADSDSDGIPDGVEDRDQDGARDPGETDPTHPDSDGDGIPDGLEDRNLNGQRDPGETDPTLADTDGDGLPDGLEDRDQDGVRDPGESDPTHPDTDGDGLPDGLEDRDQDGQLDPGETSPLSPDSDGDGLPDGLEDRDRDGQLDPGETDPTRADSDGDGIPDGLEDRDRDGALDPGETDPTHPDSDGDGLPDGLEDRNHNGRIDYGETDPLSADTDGDGVPDGLEDLDRDGVRDPGESDPTRPDTDADGVPDGAEDRDMDGVRDPGETDPTLADTDGDGLTDGQEDCNGNFAYDAGLETDPLDPDTDGDGVLDGDEDRDGNCLLGTCATPCTDDAQCTASPAERCSLALGVCVSPDCAGGETSPLTDDTDGDGLPDDQEGTTLVCSTDNLKPVDLHREWTPDVLLAVEPFFGLYAQLLSGASEVGAAFYAPTHQLAGFVISHPPAAGVTSANAQEAHDRALVAGLASVASPNTRVLDTFDGYDAVLGAYTLTLASRTPTELAAQLAEALAGGPLAGALAAQGDAAGEFAFHFETVYRGPGQVVTVGAVSATGRLDDAQIIRMNDVTNSTALAQAPDRVLARCDGFAAVGSNAVDFIWVVDNSGSMDAEQAAVQNAAQAMGDLLATTTLDWRIGVTSTDSRSAQAAGDGKLVGGNFTRDINTFRSRVVLGTSGSGSEYGLRMGIRAYERASPCDPDTDNPDPAKLRCEATLIIVVLSDEEDETIEDATGSEDYSGPPDAAAVQAQIDAYLAAEATLFAIVGGDPACPTAYNHSRGYNAVVAGLPGAASMSICDADQTANMQQVVRAASGVASAYVLRAPPISATIKVALQRVAGQPPELVPRSRTDGFDYDGTQNSLLFYGSWRPSADGLDITASYRSFEECVPATEICDGIDNDCDGEIDEVDADGDGVGACFGDCDDSDPDVFPGQTEACNGLDDNCNGFIDEGFDQDNDGWTTCAGDCDDGDPLVYPGAFEVCNGRDDDCDGEIDEGFDQDGDGWTTCAGDCDDTNPAVHPGAEEVCDGVDNNCNGLIDEGFDQDGDGFTSCGGDCDDEDPTVYPGAPELCDGKDNDCDGEVDPQWACG